MSPNPLIRWIHSYARYLAGESGQHVEIGPALLNFTGQNAGNAIAVIHHGDVTGSAVFYEDDPRPGSADVAAAIKAQSWRDNEIRTVQLGKLGPYRVSSQTPAPVMYRWSGFRWNCSTRPSAAESSVRQCFRSPHCW